MGSGKLWHYDDGGKYHTDDSGDRGKTDSISLDTIDKVNADPIGLVTVANHMNPHDSAAYNAATEVSEVFGYNADGGPSDILWGRGIYDASDLHGHQFWHERESWYNGMRPNGFPDQHYHGGKGTDQRSRFVDRDLVRADNPNLNINHTPMAGSYNTNSGWLAEHRYHGMFRNPDTQISQTYLDPHIPN